MPLALAASERPHPPPRWWGGQLGRQVSDWCECCFGAGSASRIDVAGTRERSMECTCGSEGSNKSGPPYLLVSYTSRAEKRISGASFIFTPRALVPAGYRIRRYMAQPQAPLPLG